MYIYTGWWCNNHLEKYESQLEKDYPIYGKYNRCSKPPTSMYIFDYQRASVFLASSIQSWEHVRLKLVRISTFSYLNMFLSCICKNIMYPKCRIKVLMFCLLTPFTGSHQSLVECGIVVAIYPSSCRSVFSRHGFTKK